ncbi:sensor histidine kinase [Carboxylicivirga linearis]|uniref:histidine kinase n=1 Tax=Carboxylicivirga linearis TaxID=1628157 RepID=A0ABS5JU64_9BACT|nr:HAMP domain-containing sensor histidine kinase [Carboxylicivirga linearis]MBS2098363.1 HAMP domain-containing histidine kinase [Carboxylicivirga linearis]
MKKERNNIWLAISTFLVLAVLLGIQVVYLLKAAHMSEKNFNHRVVMALKDSKDELARRICPEMDNFLCGKDCPRATKRNREAEVDSIIRANLCMYHLPLDFTFVVSDSIGAANTDKMFAAKLYQQSLNGLLQEQGLGIQIQFPDRNRFLLGQMKGLFLVSVFAIAFLVWSYIILLRMIRREKLQMAHMREFINNMLHEFQTPLANIRLATNLIRKKKNDTDKTEEYTGVILNEYDRMQTHVNEILNISCDSPEKCKKNKIDMNTMLKEVVESYQYQIQEKDGMINLNLRAEQSVIDSNNGRLAQVISNLIDNALKYVDRSPVINISSNNTKKEFILEVEDNGIGIAKKDQPYIFDQYYRVGTGDIHDVKGFGLGLNFVKKVIEEHNGRIKVESVVGKGSKFIIILPLANG